MNIVPRLGLLAAVGVSIAVCAVPVASAETTVVEIKENDTLSAIISNTYPGYRNRNALMQLILERNPDAFINNNINFLVIGKTLKLPGADELGETIQTAPPPPPAQQTVSPVVAEAELKLEQLTEERDQLRQQLTKLEIDNKALRDTVSRLEATGAQQNEQLRKLEEQIEALESLAEKQVTTSDSETISSESARQLAESGEKLEQLQARYDESIKNNQSLQQQLTEKAALESETSELKKQLAELQSGNEKQETTSTELQRQLETLKQQSESLRADNEKVLTELSAVNAKLEASQSEVDSLRTELDASNQKLQVSQSEADNLRTELNASESQLGITQSEADTLRAELGATSESNIALESEIDQIKAAAETDVTLAPESPSEKPGSNWWPWLLALLLLPVAWLLGQRSRPAPVTSVPETKTGVKTIEIPAAADPVVPEALTSEQLEQMAFSGTGAVTKPDDPDAAIKLDMARAYLDLRNAEAANDVLQEVIEEGGSRQQQEAKEIQSFIA